MLLRWICCGLLVASLGLPTAASATAQRVAPAMSADAVAVAQRILRDGDAAGRPFAIVDKRHAQLSVFDKQGRLAGVTPVLLGRTAGDHSVAGVGERTQTGRLLPGDETTPAGRFKSQPGRNFDGEAIVWLDYDAALAIHRLRAGPAALDRKRRLRTGSAHDNRASAGCVVVPPAFYVTVVEPLLGRHDGLVYILPEDGLRRMLESS
jgi:hypothetical protein